MVVTSPRYLDNGYVDGLVRDVQTRTERSRHSADRFVMNFRVEVELYADGANQVMLVPVEMRGHRFDGAVAEGDRIRAHGRLRAGTLRVKKLRNLTTGADVSVKRKKRIGCAILVLLLVCAIVIGIVLWQQYRNSF
ncbi:hypothetical protein ACFRKE_15050 [Kitasatospora indigofera]|uniref:hypothetical protein n=1 Tax=Kitasatospora indigofera TaxID=67307 RepID=UPI003686D8CC